MMETSNQKLYYSISEVAENIGVNPSLIRFWEKQIPSIVPKKTQKGNRRYTTKEIKYVKKVYHLIKVEGYTIEGARFALKNKEQSKAELVNLLLKTKSLLEKLLK